MLTVTINNTHIDRDRWVAQYKNPFDCPLARALKEQHPEYVSKDFNGVGGYGIIKGGMPKEGDGILVYMRILLTEK